METYTLRGIESMLGISKAVIGSLVASGFVSPARGKRNEYRFTFQDVVLLRTAYGLRQANIAPRKILRSLRHLRATLPSEMPLSGLRITAVGSEVAVQEGIAQRQVESGQLLFDFDVQSASGTISVLNHRSAAGAGGQANMDAAARADPDAPGAPDMQATGTAEPTARGGGTSAAPGATAAARPASTKAASTAASAPTTRTRTGAGSAQEWFARGSTLEGESADAAEQAYRRAIALDPGYVDPVLNLGALLCESGRCADAIGLYRAALAQGAADALLHFNLAVALEDLGRHAEALASYGACLALEPKFADAHFNAARLHELAGQSSQAIRHYSAYRRLSR